MWQFFLINNDKRRQREYCFMVQMYSKANIFYETLNLDTHPHTHTPIHTHKNTHTAGSTFADHHKAGTQ